MLRYRFPAGLLLLGFLWAQGAFADEGKDKAVVTSVQPSAEAKVSESLNARTLGIAEALLDYCAQNDPEGAVRVRARLKHLAQGVDPHALAEMRKSPEYRNARDSEADFISKIDSHNAHRLCTGSADRRKGK